MNRAAKNFLSLVLLLTLTFLLASCEGDEGPAGPTGPAGPSGEDAEFTIVTLSFTGTEAGITGSSSMHGVAVPEITQEIVENGAVLVYLNSSIDVPDDEWILMPFSVSFTGDTVSFNTSFEPGFANFMFSTTAVDWPYPADFNYTFKLVILSEPVKSGVDVENFEEVRVLYQEGLLERE